MATCKSCGASIDWAYTKDHKRIPLDLHAVKGGNVDRVRNGGYLEARIVEPEPEVLRYRAHFVSCPAAGEHRRKGPARRPPPGARESLDLFVDVLDDVTKRGA